MFLGRNDSSCNNKNQIYFPAGFRNETGKDLFITNWFEYSLVILSCKEGEKIMSHLSDQNVTLTPEGRRLQRFLFGGAQMVRINDENRFTLPQHLKDYAQIQKEVVFRGVGDRIELWSKESFERYSYLTDEETRQTALNLFREIKK